MAIKTYRYQFGLLDVLALERGVGTPVAFTSQTPGPLVDLSLEETFKADLDEVMTIAGWAFVTEVAPAALAAALVSPQPNVVRWAGGVTADVAPRIAYFGDMSKLDTSWSVTPFNYPLPLERKARRMRVDVATNTLTVATTFTVYLSGAATGISVVVPAGVTGTFQETAVVVSTTNWSPVDLRADLPVGVGGITFSACLLV